MKECEHAGEQAGRRGQAGMAGHAGPPARLSTCRARQAPPSRRAATCRAGVLMT
eukprot:gene20841-25031_t